MSTRAVLDWMFVMLWVITSAFITFGLAFFGLITWQIWFDIFLIQLKSMVFFMIVFVIFLLVLVGLLLALIVVGGLSGGEKRSLKELIFSQRPPPTKRDNVAEVILGIVILFLVAVTFTTSLIAGQFVAAILNQFWEIGTAAWGKTLFIQNVLNAAFTAWFSLIMLERLRKSEAK